MTNTAPATSTRVAHRNSDRMTAPMPWFSKFRRIVNGEKTRPWNDLKNFNKAVKYYWQKNWANKYGLGYNRKRLKPFYEQYADGSSTSKVQIVKMDPPYEKEHKVILRSRVVAGEIVLTGFSNTVGWDNTSFTCHPSMSEIQKKKTGEETCLDGPMFFLNHSCNPNCSWAWNNEEEIWEVKIRKHRLRPGTELTIHYGKKSFDIKAECRCGSYKCPRVRRQKKCTTTPEMINKA